MIKEFKSTGLAHCLHFFCLMYSRTKRMFTFATFPNFLIIPHIHVLILLWPHLSHNHLPVYISSTCLCVFFSLLFCFCPSLYTRPPNLSSYTLCLTHLLSARQVFVAKRQAMSDGLLLRERHLSIMISYLPVLYARKLDFSYGSCSGVLWRGISADCAFALFVFLIFALNPGIKQKKL